MNFRRWVVFTFAIHLLVIVIDKGAGFVLYKITEDNPGLKGAADMLTTLPFIMMSVANLGLATSLVYHVRKKNYDVQRVAEATSMVALIWGGLVALIAFPTIWFVVPLLQPEWELDLWLVLPLCLCVPLLLLCSYFNSIQLATDRVRDYNLLHLVGSVTFLPLFLLVFWFTGRVTEGIAIARLGTAGLLAILVVVMLRRIVKLRPRFHWDFIKDGVAFGWRANITSVLTYLNLRINIFLIPLFFIVQGGHDGQQMQAVAMAQVGFYSLALTFAELVWHFPEATRDLFFSRLAGSTHEEARRLTPVLARLCLVVSVVGGLCIYPVVSPMMSLISDHWGPLWSGPVLESLLYLLPGTVAFTVAKIIQNDLAARGHLTDCIKACSIVTVSILVADLVFVPERGAAGAAIATSIGYLASSLFCLFIYWRRTGVGCLEVLIVRRSDWRYAQMIISAVLDKVFSRRRS